MIICHKLPMDLLLIFHGYYIKEVKKPEVEVLSNLITTAKTEITKIQKSPNMLPLEDWIVKCWELVN